MQQFAHINQTAPNLDPRKLHAEIASEIKYNRIFTAVLPAIISTWVTVITGNALITSLLFIGDKESCPSTHSQWKQRKDDLNRKQNNVVTNFSTFR